MKRLLEKDHLAGLPPMELRSAISDQFWCGPTLGLALGHLQANLVILPQEFAMDFTLFCLRNPKPCPLIEVTDPGSPYTREVATKADLRSTLPKYRVFTDGALTAEPLDISDHWRDDAVAFLLGCSLTFEGGTP